MKFLAALAFMAIGLGAGAQGIVPQDIRPVRLAVYHADPWMIKALLEATPIVSPEISTLLGFMGLPASAGKAINAFFTDGTLIVNPTDNSLWFFPNKPKP